MFKNQKGNVVVGTIIAVVITAIVGVTVSAGWFSSGSAPDAKEERRVEDQQNIYVDSQPIPFFDWSLERHIFIELYQARNNAVTTYSYVRNWQGQVYFSCESIGFPMPANMQLTNPERTEWAANGGSHALPQPEPNGLFSSPSNIGTYVFCVNSDGTVSPSYFEDKVESHLAPLNNNLNGLSGDGALKIKTNK